MSELYDRRCIVEVDGVRFEGLRTVFRVELTTASAPNKLELDIYNLSALSRSKIKRTGATVKLQAGYQNNLGLLFSGDATTTTHSPIGADVITKIIAGDGETAIRGARFEGSFGENTLISDVLLKMLGGFEAKGLNTTKAKARIAQGDFRGAFTEFANGFAFSGPLTPEFERQLKSVGLTWSVQKGEVQILSSTETTQDTAYRLGVSSGLLGSPSIDDKGVVKLSAMMLSDLVPGKRVIVESRMVSKTIKLTKVVFRGDTHGDEWIADCEGKPV